MGSGASTEAEHNTTVLEEGEGEDNYDEIYGNQQEEVLGMILG